MRRVAREESPAAPSVVPRRDSLLVGLLALAFTLPLTPNVSGDKDAGEFALVLARFAAAHPTGYPLYTLAGGLFVHLLHACGAPFVFAANAWSAAGGAVAAGLLHALVARLLAREGLARREASLGGALAAAALVFHPLWTAATTQAEVHSWHVAWVLAITTTALAFTSSEAAPVAVGAGRLPPAFAWGILVGWGLGHHATSVLVSLPLTIAVVITHLRTRADRGRAIAGFALGATIPLLAYLFIAWRAFHPTAGQWGSLAPAWSSVLAHVTAREYHLYGGHYAPSGPERELIDRDVLPWLAVAVPAAAAWTLLARRTPPAFRWGVLAAIAATLGFVRFYGVADPSAYFLPPLVLALATLPALAASFAFARRIRKPLALVATLAIAVAAIAGVRAALARNAAFRAEDARIHDLWSSIAPARGFVLWSDDRIAVLRGYQLLRGEKPRLEILHPMLLTQDWPRVQFRNRHGFDPVSRAAIAAAAGRAHPRDVQELSALMSTVIALTLDVHSPLPVMVFRPDADEVRTLPKGAAADSLFESVTPGAADGDRR